MIDRKSIAILALFTVSPFANASGSDGWKTYSDVGAYGLVGIALGLPAYNDDWKGFRQAGYSIVTAASVGLVGKSQIDAERPDKTGNDSFPSNHTANSFAAATTLNLRYGWQVGLPAYGFATLVGVGRVKADRHHWRDVLAGATIGSLSGWAFTNAYDSSVRVAPWADRHEAGLTVTLVW